MPLAQCSASNAILPAAPQMLASGHHKPPGGASAEQRAHHIQYMGPIVCRCSSQHRSNCKRNTCRRKLCADLKQDHCRLLKCTSLCCRLSECGDVGFNTKRLNNRDNTKTARGRASFWSIVLRLVKRSRSSRRTSEPTCAVTGPRTPLLSAFHHSHLSAPTPLTPHAADGPVASHALHIKVVLWEASTQHCEKT